MPEAFFHALDPTSVAIAPTAVGRLEDCIDGLVDEPGSSHGDGSMPESHVTTMPLKV